MDYLERAYHEPFDSTADVPPYPFNSYDREAGSSSALAPPHATNVDAGAGASKIGRAAAAHPELAALAIGAVVAASVGVLRWGFARLRRSRG
jgi:hypothetical protein